MASYRSYRYKRYRYRSSGKVPPGAIVAVAAVVLLSAAGGTAARHHGHHPSVADFTTSGSAGRAISYARHQIGKPYVWGGIGPSGYDCSGLVMEAYRSAGISLPRTSQEQWAQGHHVSRPRPGDLVFFAGSDGTTSAPGHVGLVVGSHLMIEAYATGFAIRESQFGTAASAPGDGDPVGFTDPGGRVVTDAAVHAASSYTPASWTVTLLHVAGYRATTCNRAAIRAWIHAEGSKWSWRNPLDDERPEPGSYRVNDTGHGTGVMAYPTWGDGLSATRATLAGPDYSGIRAALRAGNSAQRVADAVARSPWGTEAFEAAC